MMFLDFSQESVREYYEFIYYVFMYYNQNQ